MIKFMSKEEDIKNLEEEIKNCRRCGLWKTRNKPVAGEGSLNPSVMFIGEAPGYNEDVQGRPFVGRAGTVFNELLKSIGLERKDVYITNIVKCRPPNNRDPFPEEIKACIPSLDRQIVIIRPGVIAALGRLALFHIFEKFGLKQEKISRVHGKIFNVTSLIGNLKIVPLYHPAIATYNPEMKGILFEDFKSIKQGSDKNANV